MPLVDPSLFASENAVVPSFLDLDALRVPLAWDPGESDLREGRRR